MVYMKEINQNPEQEPLIESLNQCWNNLCQRLDINNDQNSFNKIVENYSEEHRHYHTLKHIESCLKEFESVKEKINNPEAVELAIWYHDILYTIGENDNEEQSAKMAKDFCQKHNLSIDFSKEVVDHILATKHISPSNNQDSKYLADIDMSILGQSNEVFDNYERQIYKEYSNLYSKSEYQQGRIQFLKSISNKPIYLTDFFQNKYQEKAKSNIERDIESLHNYKV